MDYRRNSRDLNDVIEYAKLDAKNITKVCQAIYFPNFSNGNNYKLLELDQHMLKEIESGQNLVFKGGLHEKVVLCSSNETYEVRNAEQSNSMLVIPELLHAEATSDSPLQKPLSDNINKSLDKSLENEENETSQPPLIDHQIEHKQILKIFYDYLECRQIKPRIKKIQDLIHLNTYNGSENEHLTDRHSMFSRRQLFDTAQCSAGEFDEILKKIRCIEVNGFMRLLDYGYEYRVVTLMMSVMTENSWGLEEVDRNETLTALDGIVPNEITEAMFEFYTEEVAETGKFRYKEDMVCRIIAQNVLQEGLKFHIDEFFETCQGALPDGMQMKEEYLDGIGIVDRESSMPNIRGLFEENLPMNLSDRLRKLFKTMPRWTLSQISPYVEVFTTPQLGVTSLLAKNVRSVTENGIRFYVAKHHTILFDVRVMLQLGSDVDFGWLNEQTLTNRNG
ncbi:CLUMA_CG006166, isoform A [Clunio marinus]|uniref:Sister chromatid cohesion protein DCC1 n=1 Tax=Clunio marinus TaxID=568069 RepID=A0A1J1I194_9DIPT|nr:CLUMA_CG006166, isoform A [Clunio marinus]